MPDRADFAMTPQREFWDGHPVTLGEAWRMEKGGRVARCLLMSHQFGWELRLTVGDLLRTQVCRSTDEILTTQESWKAAMSDKGWR
jgi:hypothetical protein